MDQPPTDNQTDFHLHPQVLIDKDGEKLAAMVKGTFEMPKLDGELELASDERMRPLWLNDVPWDKPDETPVAYPCDLCLRKPGTDVIFVGTGYAPQGKPVPSFDVMVQVGQLRKALKIYGLRVWEKNGTGISDARPVTQMDLRYDYAWGGLDDSDPEKIVEEARNPMGMGCVRDPAALSHQPAPNIEDPAEPIVNYKTRPQPAGVGPIGRHWMPRRQYAGTYDDAWQELRAPLLPDDFDDRHNIAASPGLHSDVPLMGGEDVYLLNVIPGKGALQFKLPRVALEIEFRVEGREPQIVRPFLDTVLIDALEIGRDKPFAVEMVWRAHTKAPRRMRESNTIVREASL